jgi:hypothetical protein
MLIQSVYCMQVFTDSQTFGNTLGSAAHETRQPGANTVVPLYVLRQGCVFVQERVLYYLLLLLAGANSPEVARVLVHSHFTKLVVDR